MGNVKPMKSGEKMVNEELTETSTMESSGITESVKQPFLKTNDDSFLDNHKRRESQINETIKDEVSLAESSLNLFTVRFESQDQHVVMVHEDGIEKLLIKKTQNLIRSNTINSEVVISRKQTKKKSHETQIKTQLEEQVSQKSLKTEQCTKCNKSFAPGQGMTYHSRKCHAGKFICQYCGEEWKGANAKTKLRVHIEGKHLGEKSMHCDQCTFQASTKHGLMLHTKTKHENIRYKCKLCDHEATQEGSLRKHVKNIHEGFKHPCHVCGKVFTSEGSRNKHVDYKHGDRKHPCSQCDYIAGQMHHLKTHTSLMHTLE